MFQSTEHVAREILYMLVFSYGLESEVTASFKFTRTRHIQVMLHMWAYFLQYFRFRVCLTKYFKLFIQRTKKSKSDL